ncbi:hypothetical protein HanIR_Chr17g0846701 [Helianthus annuus]|nr:hypothetical protein HanIR_Chr17g0846701 [Helianthus annuus]
MSLMWVPRDPRAAPIYAYKGKGYRMMNVLDPEVGGEITARLFSEGEKPWVEQIRDNFLRPSSKNLNTYVATPLGAHLPISVKSEVDKPPAREEAILLSSEEYTGSSHGLIHCSRVQVPARELFRLLRVMLHPSPPLQSLRLSPLNLGRRSLKRRTRLARRMKRHVAADEEDQATLTQMTEKKWKLLASEKRELDAQVALDLTERKIKVMGQVAAPSESEVDLGVFAKKSGNILEELYEESSKKKGTTF